VDGDMDVLVHHMRQPEEAEAYSGGTWWINQGGMQEEQDGQFIIQPGDIEVGRASKPADLDGDGDLDVLVYDGHCLIVGINQGGEQGGQPGSIREVAWVRPSPGQEAQVGQVTQYGWLLVGDINQDDRPDAVVLGWGRVITSKPETEDRPNLSWIWLNQLDADGRYIEEFVTIEGLAGIPVSDAELADLNGDGSLDLIVVLRNTQPGINPGPTAFILLNDGTGRFYESDQRLEAGKGTSLAVGDLDGDGDLDVMIGYERGVTVWTNQGGAQAGQVGTFLAGERDIRGSRVHTVRAADLDGDGDADALVVGVRQAVLWWNDGQGRFSKGDSRFPVQVNQDLTVGDFNGDGHLDIFVAEYDKRARVWFNDGSGRFEAGEWE
jgi:hypothetical protein